MEVMGLIGKLLVIKLPLEATILFTRDTTNSFANRNNRYISNLQTAWAFPDLLDKLLIGSGKTPGATDFTLMWCLQVHK